MGLPLRIAIPILVVFAALFLGVLGWFLRIGFSTTGSAFGPGSVPEQGDARIAATPAPIATEPAGTFTVPQTGTGRVAPSTALPGAGVGGGTPAGPPAPIAQALAQLRARIASNPRDVAALVQLGDLELAAAKYDRASAYFDRALTVSGSNGEALYGRAVALRGLARNADAIAAYRRYLSVAGSGAPHADDARAALRQLGG
ncbi:MAG TPA: tetratricopeptide repeat protein [Candidatus Elarobacter sp.]|nr:tetratricopeptide repeat protein [Candidatus Elarobacter sp.]